jgi:hypothetical protein
MGLAQWIKNRNPPMVRDGVGGSLKSAINPFSSHQSPTEKFFSPVMHGKQYMIQGYTKDSAGSILANCVVTLFYTNNDVMVGKTTSDANGLFTFLVGPVYQCYIVQYKAGSPDVCGTTANTLVAS